MPQLPHQDVYTRLGRSRRHGIGVFAIRTIPKGTFVFPEDHERMIWVPEAKVRNLPKALKSFYDDFSIIRNGRYGSPRRFDALTPAWYLNHSNQPNLAADRSYRFYALRDIREGEELTVDYNTYSELPVQRTSQHRRRSGVKPTGKGRNRPTRERI